MSIISFLGNHAGKSAAEWTKNAVEWSVKGGHGSNVIDCCYNAARAALGNGATGDAIRTYATELIRNITR